jgi:hypothetical protein
MSGSYTSHPHRASIGVLWDCFTFYVTFGDFSKTKQNSCSLGRKEGKRMVKRKGSQCERKGRNAVLGYVISCYSSLNDLAVGTVS